MAKLNKENCITLEGVLKSISNVNDIVFTGIGDDTMVKFTDSTCLTHLFNGAHIGSTYKISISENEIENADVYNLVSLTGDGVLVFSRKYMDAPYELSIITNPERVADYKYNSKYYIKIEVNN